MGFEAWLTVAVVGGVFALLATDRFSSEVVVVGGLVVLLVTGVLTPVSAFSGFANPGVASLAALYVVTAGLRETGALDRPAQLLLERAPSAPSARRRLTLVTTGLSAFLNNTPIVALFMPLATTWARRRGRSGRGLLMPLSYAAVLGGTCTMLGTSVHLVVHGLLLQHDMPGMQLFELTPIGLPVALICLPALWLLSRRFLDPTARLPQTDEEVRREYTADLMVTADAPFLGQTVEAAGLRHLSGLFLVQIERGDQVITPVGPDDRLAAGDRLTFAGVLDTLVDLQRRRGLEPPQARHVEPGWVMHQAVVSRGSRLEGRGIREMGFRTRYHAAVVGVHRHGERIEQRIGDIVLRHGDTLLLLAAPGFSRAFRDAAEFYLISEVADTERPRHRRAPIALLIMAAVVTLAATQVLPLVTAAAAGSLAMVGTGCLSPGQARRSIDMSVLAVVAAALGIARALEETGAAAALASALSAIAADLGPVALIAAVYITGMLLTELVTNTAAAALLFPVALEVAAVAHLDPRPFVLATSIAASISLATPLGYQTNMMVYGPGGYRFADFLRMGVPLQVLAAIVAITALTIRYSLW